MPSPQRVKTITATRSEIVSTDPTNRPVFFQIDGNSTVYIGDDTVTSANGFPIAKHAAPIQFLLSAGQSLWAICAAGQTETLRIFTTPEDV